MKILGFEKDQGACNHYRLVQPLYKLRQHKLADILTIHPKNSHDLEFVTQKIMEADIIVLQRLFGDEWLNLLKVIQNNGKIMAVDYDDDPFNTSPLNPAYRYFGAEEVLFKWPDGKEDALWEDKKNGFFIETNIRRRDIFKAAFRRADIVSTTTPILQQTFLKLNKNTVVLPNLIDFDLYPKIECVKKEIRIGWQGGSSHYEDLYIIAGAIKKIVKEYNNVKFVFWGDTRFWGLFKDIPKDRIEWHSWLNYMVYPYKLATLNLDIGLCPIIDNTFNRNKSAIKYFEYSVMNVATIASNMPPYSSVITHRKDGLLIAEDEWYEAMKILIGDKKKRLYLAKNAYDNIFENHNADKKVHLWAGAYEKLLKKDVTELVEAK